MVFGIGPYTLYKHDLLDWRGIAGFYEEESGDLGYHIPEGILTMFEHMRGYRLYEDQVELKYGMPFIPICPSEPVPSKKTNNTYIKR